MDGKEAHIEESGLFTWDPAARVIREMSADEETGRFASGTWKPDGNRLVGEFTVFEEDGTRRKESLVLQFLDKTTMRITGDMNIELKRSGDPVHVPARRLGDR
jgi:hypothetical protein